MKWRLYLESLEERALPSNLVVNGGFEEGNTGFTSDYRYTPGDLDGFERYSITPDPRLDHPLALSFGDHTTGSGLMMAVNGPRISDNLTVWAQTVPVQPNESYVFSSWVATWSSEAPPEMRALLDFSINGISLATFRAPPPGAVWDAFSAIWDSGSAASASIRIVVINPGTFIHNDFALDDISLSGYCTSLFADGTELTATVNQRFAAVVASFVDPCDTPGTALDYVAIIDWGDGDFSTGGISDLGSGSFDVAASHTYHSVGEFWATVVIIDARIWDRYAIAYTYVNVVPADRPGPGGGWDADLLAALDAIHGDPWKERRPDYAAFELLPL